MQNFDDAEKKAPWKIIIVGEKKENMMATGIFSFSHNVLYPSKERFQHLSHIEIVVCKCF